MRLRLPWLWVPRLWSGCAEAALGISCLVLGAGLLTVALAEVAGATPSPTATTPSGEASAASTDPRNNLPATSISYQLRATLDAELHSVEGSGSIRFTNSSTRPTSELYLHLYLNAFKNSESLFQRSPFHGARSGDKSPTPGYIDVRRLVAKEWDGVDLWANAERHSPGDARDETDIRVPLPRDLAAGESLTLELAWHAQLPQLSERTGYVDDFHLIAQWFPKLAKLEPDGRWAHFAFHPHAEFYADFADYDVTIDVAQSQVVGASGALVSEEINGDRKQLRYRASTVHDFAWTAWPQFLEHRETIDGVAVRVLYPEAASPLLERELNALRFGLPHFSRAYGRYPYPTLTVVHPPANAAAAGGMEYPTLITTGGTVLPNLVSRGIELVTLHELGHQWFYGLLANNEAATPFLDEGLNSYAESVAADQLWGAASGGSFWDLQISAEALRRAQAASAQHDTAVSAAAADFADFGSLGALVYSRTTTILQTLRGVYGAEAVQRALAVYSDRFRFGHPTTENFLGTMREALGDDAGIALRSLIDERGWLDYTVERIDCVPAREQRGVFETEQGRVTTPESAANPSNDWVGEVLVRRHGTVSLPVDVLLIARDGSTSRRHWNGAEPWLRIEYRGSSPLAGAIVDPDLRLPIDSNLLNNAASLNSPRTPRSFERLLYAAQWALFATTL